MKKIVVLTGAGISAESGIKTFRDSNGLWEGHDVMEVASPQGWRKNMELVLDFYNQRRRQLAQVKPNAAHYFLADLETKFDVQIITQNVDDLHERGGSTNVMHLHGKLTHAKSTLDENLRYDIGYKDINIGDNCEKGAQLRPHIVWFGEAVPMMEKAAPICHKADAFVVIGTSMVVYPAASLIEYVPHHIPKFIIDPHLPDLSFVQNLTCIKATATEGVKQLGKLLDGVI